MTIFILLIIGIVVGVAAAVVAGTRKVGKEFSAANQIVPGVSTLAPAEWAGAHSPEARLHRRMRDAIAAVRANTTTEDPALADARVTLERHTLALDDRLIAVAALPPASRAPRLTDIEAGVVALEAAVAELVDLRGAGAIDFEAGLAEVRARIAFVAEARSELDALDGTSSSLQALKEEIAAAAEQATAAPDTVTPPPIDGPTAPPEA